MLLAPLYASPGEMSTTLLDAHKCRNHPGLLYSGPMDNNVVEEGRSTDPFPIAVGRLRRGPTHLRQSRVAHAPL